MDIGRSVDYIKSQLLMRTSPFTLATVVIIGFGGLLSVFDILRLTVFVDASWNYNYPYWHFVYDPLPLLILVGLLAVVILTVPKWLELSSTQFAATLFLTSVVVFGLGLFALPLELTKALDVDKRGLFNGAVYLVENGPIDFLGSFNSLPQTAPEHEDLYIWEFNPSPENPAANRFAEWMGALDWIPFNDGFARYVDAYTAQKHGPVSVLFVAPFLLLFGKTTAAALLGNIIIACLIPVVGYFTFRLHFSELLSRLGAVFVAIAPGLFIWTRHAAPVPYDIVTALLVACSLYTFLRAIESDRPLFYALTGVFVSLASLTKLTGLLILLPIGIVLIRNKEEVASFGRRLGTIVASWLVVLLLFLVAGYNFLAQYVFTVYKLTFDKIWYDQPNGRAGGPADALNDSVIGLIGTLYNGRWMSVVLLALAFVFVGYVIYARHLLRKDHAFISVTLLTSFLPFGVWVLFSSGTLSRHTVVLLIPFGFIALSGLSIVTTLSDSVSLETFVRFGQVTLVVGCCQFLVNI